MRKKTGGVCICMCVATVFLAANALSPDPYNCIPGWKLVLVYVGEALWHDCKICEAGNRCPGGGDLGNWFPCIENNERQPLPGQSFCVECAEHTYSSWGFNNGVPGKHGNMQDCPECPHQSPWRRAGQASCTLCPAGRTCVNSTYNPLCEPGTFKGSAGSQPCFPCAPGTYSGVAGALECNRCEPGKYSSMQATGCVDCPVGKYEPDWGSSECQLCAKGSWSGDTGRKTPCDACGLGKYANEAGNSEVSFPVPHQLRAELNPHRAPSRNALPAGQVPTTTS